jgi:hypothetical protein
MNITVPDQSSRCATSRLAVPTIEVTWGDPFILTVSGATGTYDWNTGSTEDHIEVTPPNNEWYWVKVTSSSSCIEAAVESPIFGDGFESGDTSGW